MFEKEELMAVVIQLLNRYTSFDRDSVTYEKAEQLMEAAAYCLREYEAEEKNAAAQSLSPAERLSAAEAYERGYRLVVEKTKKANWLYNEIMTQFCDYGSRAYRDTMLRELPEFFLRYDARFAPQSIPVELSYPAPAATEQLCGIDRIYEYLLCIRREQEFLRGFPESHIRQVCRDYHEDYEELFISLTEIITSAAGSRKPPAEAEFLLSKEQLEK